MEYISGDIADLEMRCPCYPLSAFCCGKCPIDYHHIIILDADRNRIRKCYSNKANCLDFESPNCNLCNNGYFRIFSSTQGSYCSESTFRRFLLFIFEWLLLIGAIIYAFLRIIRGFLRTAKVRKDKVTESEPKRATYSPPIPRNRKKQVLPMKVRNGQEIEGINDSFTGIKLKSN